MARIETDTVSLYKETNPTGPVITTAKLTITKHSDGQYEFTGADGLVWRTSDAWAAKVFAAIDALV